jgi:hypothetical protein
MQGPRAFLAAIVTGFLVFSSPAEAAWRAVCREDLGRFCPPDQKPPEMLQCLRAHQSELSAFCA